MVKVVVMDEDFRRMLRVDLRHFLQKPIDSGKFGRHKVPSKDTTIHVEMAKRVTKSQ